MAKDNLNKKTAYSVKNVKDSLNAKVVGNENLMKNTHVPKFIDEQVQKNQKIYEENQQRASNKSGGNSGQPKHFYSNDPNSYKPMDSFSDYFNKNSSEFDMKGNKPVNFNIGEMYKGFAKFNSYAWGIAASIALAAYVGFKMVDKAHQFKTNKNIENKQGE